MEPSIYGNFHAICLCRCGFHEAACGGHASGAIVRGELAKMKMGSYCVIGKNSVMHPNFYDRPQGGIFLPMKIGDYVTVGDGAPSSLSVCKVELY
eukprot:SAG11_NODE_9299_length_924_cov_1.998788_1_plen_95_part_00